MNRKIVCLSLIIVILFISGCAPIRALLAGEYDNMKSVTNDDAEMNTAIQQVQDTLPIFIEALQNPQPGQTDFSIKVKFPYGSSDAAEHIWLNDVSNADEQFIGYIGNTPVYISDLAYGDKVTVSTKDVSDWTIIQDERLLGGFTIYVLLGETSAADREDFRKENGLILSEQPVTE